EKKKKKNRETGRISLLFKSARVGDVRFEQKSSKLIIPVIQVWPMQSVCIPEGSDTSKEFWKISMRRRVVPSIIIYQATYYLLGGHRQQRDLHFKSSFRGWKKRRGEAESKQLQMRSNKDGDGILNESDQKRLHPPG
ncbi:hypothetical protein ABKV19_026701, partial [Rosa sericea]